MNTQAEKNQKNNSQYDSIDISQSQIRNKSTFQFVDNRPESITQRKLQETANNSKKAKQTAQLKSMASNHYDQLQQANLKPDRSENNTGLPDNLKSGIENLSSYSMDDVKVYRNSNKPAQLQAHAHAHGSEIYLGTGQEKHLPHEAWHMIQQKQGRVKPTTQLKGHVKLNDDAGLEKEADLKGAKALMLKADVPCNANPVKSNDESIIQRYITDEEGTPISYSEVWEEIGEIVDGTEYDEKLQFYIESNDGYKLNDVVNALDPESDIKPIVPFTNMLGRNDVGCSVCVAANYLKMTDKELIKYIFDTKDQSQIDLIKDIYKNGDSKHVTSLYMSLGIYLADESFDNYEQMINELTSDPDGPAWSGALAW